jgi:hypothetical protein
VQKKFLRNNRADKFINWQARFAILILKSGKKMPLSRWLIEQL